MLEPWAAKIMYYMAHATVILLAVVFIAIIIILVGALIVGCIELIKSILKGMRNNENG